MNPYEHREPGALAIDLPAGLGLVSLVVVVILIFLLGYFLGYRERKGRG